MRLRALPLLVLLATGLMVPTSTPASAATAPSVVTVRSAASTVGETPPLSLAVVHGVAGGIVGLGSADGGRMTVDAHKNVEGQSWSWGLMLPRNLRVGTYSFDVNGGGAFAILGSAGNCQQGTGTVLVRDAAWTSTGNVVRLSVSVTAPCGNAPGATTYAEIRIGEPAPGGNLGLLEGPSTVFGASTTVGTPVPITRTFTNAGSGPVTLGTAAIGWARRTDYPAFSLGTDGCKGKTLAPRQTCDVVVTFDPKLVGTEIATLTVPDGRPRPAGTALYGTAANQPDQPGAVGVSGQLQSASVTWRWPNASTTGRVYDAYEVVSVDASGTPIATVATVDGTSARGDFRVDLDGLADRTVYTYAVRAVLAGGQRGPLSVPVSASTAGRLLLYADRAGQHAVSADPLGASLVRLARDLNGGRQAMSPDRSTLAVADRIWNGTTHSCTLRVLSRTGTSEPVDVSRPTVHACDTSPTFTSATTVVFSRTDDASDPAAAPYLASYDLGTAIVTAVPGGAGLTQPAAAPDGSVVAVDPVTTQLVRLDLGTGVVTPIPGTTGATQPAVSSAGRIAFLTSPGSATNELVTVDAGGSDPRVLTANNGSGFAQTPSWTSDGSTVYFAQGSDVWRVGLTGTAPTNVTATPGTYEEAPLVLDVPDTAGPVVTGRPALPAFTRATSLSYPVTATDPGPAGSGVTSYDGQYRTGPAGGALGAPVGWTGSSTGSFTLALDNGQRYCLSVRATDAVGNVGPWSSEQCTVADRSAPAFGALSTPALFNAANRVTLTFRYADTGAGVANYTARYRAAPAGGGFAAHRTSAALTTGSYPLGLTPGYQYCLSVRATDKVGNVSGWSPERCTIAALDDRALASAGTVSRLASSAFHAGTATQLRATGARLTYPKVSTTRVAVLVRTCSTCGPVEVLVNGVRVATLNTYSSTLRNQVLLWTPRFSATRTGPLVLRQSSSKTVFVDGVVVQHT